MRLSRARRSPMYAAYWQVVKAFLNPKVVGPVVVLAGWTVGLAALAHQVSLWESDVLSDTVVWFVTVGIAFYFSLQSVGEDGFWHRPARRAVGVMVFVEVFVNLAVFSLPIELILVPFVSVVVMLSAFSEGEDEYRPAHRLASFVLGVVGAVFVVHVTASLLDDLAAAQTVRKLLLPIWLTLGATPLIYGVGLWSAYEQAFIRIDSSTDDAAGRRRARRALFSVAHVRAPDVVGLGGHWVHDLTGAASPHAAREVVRRCRGAWRSERRAGRTSNARAFMHEWLTHPDATLAEVHGDALQRSWERLDHEQRATLKAEASRLRRAKAARLDGLLALPD